MNCGPCLLVGNCLPDDWLLLYLHVKSNVYDLLKGTCFSQLEPVSTLQ